MNNITGAVQQQPGGPSVTVTQQPPQQGIPPQK